MEILADIDWNPLIVAIAASIPGIVSAWLTKIGNNKVDKIEKTVNGRMDQLLKESVDRSHAEGFMAGQQTKIKGK